LKFLSLIACSSDSWRLFSLSSRSASNRLASAAAAALAISSARRASSSSYIKKIKDFGTTLSQLNNE